jgi:uncharacterized protein YbjT (DUF2867 family)
MKVVVAGATGALGKLTARSLVERGASVRALVRDEKRAPEKTEVIVCQPRNARTLAGVMKGADVVFSALGASTLPGLSHGWRSFSAVDWVANRNLADAAAAEGVKRFVYVSVACADRIPGSDYVRAHEAVVAHLAERGLRSAIIRPTGFFSVWSMFLGFARSGRIPEIGGGAARSNPIADEDLAALAADVVMGGRDGDVPCGGPDVLSRRDISELAFQLVGKKPRYWKMPAGLLRAGSVLARPFWPRMAGMARFFADISTNDLIVPVVGKRRLEDHFRASLLLS